MENLLSFLKEKNIEYICNEPMKNHTTFKVGGNAEFFVKVKSVDELSALIKFITIRKLSIVHDSSVIA